MTWPQAFIQLAQIERSAAKGMLHFKVLPQETTPAQRITALMVSQLLAQPPGERPLLNLLIPPDGARSALIATTGLLITDFLHQQRQEGRRLNGDVLLITHAIAGSLDHLENLQLGDSDIRFSKFWSVDSFSRYAPAVSDRPQVIVANPGWIARLDTLQGRIGSVIVDATHPRTFSRLAELERATRKVPLRVFMTPPFGTQDLADLGEAHKRLTWLWSPGARRAIADALYIASGESNNRQRSVFVCQDDPVFDQALAAARSLLLALMGLTRTLPHLLDAWSIYHRMRQLTVPLLQYEALAKRHWGGMMLREQIVQLRSASLPTAALQGPWTQLTQRLDQAYDLLSQRREPAKLHGIAQRIEALIEQDGPPLFVITSSQTETEILQEAVSALVPSFKPEEFSGRVEFIGAREEARRVSSGEEYRSILPGYRYGRLRYLDAYPSVSSESVLYPHEVPLEQGLHARTYDALEALQTSEHLRQTLQGLGMAYPAGDISTPSIRPKLHILDLNGQPVHLLRQVATQDAALSMSSLDMDDLISAELRRLNLDHAGDVTHTRSKSASEAQIVLHFEDGPLALDGARLVDVFYPDTGKLIRHCARDVSAGMYVVSMVDDAYSTLFERLVEALDARAPVTHRLALQLWRQAKTNLLNAYPSIRALHRVLREDGVTVDYTTLRSWLIEFGNESQSYPPMRLLALRSGVYPSEDMIRHTYAAIVAVRGRNRTAGRSLHTVLRAIASGEGYSTALSSARRIDASVSEVLAAVELRRLMRVSSLDP